MASKEDHIKKELYEKFLKMFLKEKNMDLIIKKSGKEDILLLKGDIARDFYRHQREYVELHYQNRVYGFSLEKGGEIKK